VRATLDGRAPGHLPAREAVGEEPNVAGGTTGHFAAPLIASAPTDGALLPVRKVAPSIPIPEPTMTAPIASSAPPAATSAPANNAVAEQKFEQLLGQNMLIRMQANQQAMSKSMNKMTESIKNSVKDEE
jgi:hypothetical protein